MPKDLPAKEQVFWRLVAALLGLLLVVCVVANTVRDEAVPSSVMLLLFGSLVAIGIGATIVNPRSSPVVLARQREVRFRRSQYLVGFVFSLNLGLLIMLSELRGSPLVWLFAPIIALPCVLVLRERLVKS